MKKTISLGTSYGPESIPAPVVGDANSVSYPGVYLTFKESDEIELPDSGTLTVKFRVVRELEDKKRGTCSYDLELTEVVAVKPSPEEKEEYKEESAEEAVEKAFKSKK